MLRIQHVNFVGTKFNTWQWPLRLGYNRLCRFQRYFWNFLFYSLELPLKKFNYQNCVGTMQKAPISYCKWDSRCTYTYIDKFPGCENIARWRYWPVDYLFTESVFEMPGSKKSDTVRLNMKIMHENVKLWIL